MRRRVWRGLAAGLALLLALAGVAYARASWEVRNTVLNETAFATDELVGELRVVQLTDFHNIPRPEQIDQIVELVRGARPDLIALTGDMVNSPSDALDPVDHLLSGLAEIGAPMVHVDGNHDHPATGLHAVLAAHGVTVLANEAIPFEGAFGSVQLVGVDDYYSGHGDIEAAVAGLPDDGFRLVLTHSPGILPLLGEAGVDYAMCGHTHGGQVRLPLIGALYQAGGDYFPRVSKGIYRDEDATLYIDSGIGVSGPPYRFLNPSQVTLHRIGPA
ncbi:MAG: metallophosphoesterase [Arachnia sp.]